MSDLPDHFCPGCGAAQRAFARYPWHLCRACCEGATDGDGRAIRVSGGMGFAWRYRDEDDTAWRSCLGIVARIAGRPAFITEARFGGVVAEPVSAPSIDTGRPGITNLLRRSRPLPGPD